MWAEPALTCVESRGNQQEREEQRAEQPGLEQRASVRKSSKSPTPSCAWQRVPACPVQKGIDWDSAAGKSSSTAEELLREEREKGFAAKPSQLAQTPEVSASSL